jgi:hypothetical protein
MNPFKLLVKLFAFSDDMPKSEYRQNKEHNISEEDFEEEEDLAPEPCGSVSDFLDGHKNDSMTKDGFYETPIRCNELDAIEPDHYVFQWLFFNPMGPTWMFLSLWEDVDSDKVVIGTGMSHPFNSGTTIYGVLDHSVYSSPELFSEKMFAMLEHSFSQEEFPITSSLPTSVLPINSPFMGSNAIKQFFYLVAEYAEEFDLERSCELLEEYRGDPWGRTKIEQNESMSGLSEALERINKGEGASPTDCPQKPDDFDELFTRWWRLVTNHEHTDSEVEQFPHAYKGAIQFANGEFC